MWPSNHQLLFRFTSQRHGRLGKSVSDTLYWLPSFQKRYRSEVFFTLWAQMFIGLSKRFIRVQKTRKTMRKFWRNSIIISFPKEILFMCVPNSISATKKKSDESIEEYLRALNDLAEHADFPDMENCIRDRLVLSIQDEELSLNLRLEATVTLKSAVKTARQFEEVKLELQGQRGSIAFAAINIALHLVDNTKTRLCTHQEEVGAKAEAEAEAEARDWVSSHCVSVAIHTPKEDVLQEERHAERAKRYNVTAGRRVAFPLQEKVREELDRMEKGRNNPAGHKTNRLVRSHCANCKAKLEEKVTYYGLIISEDWIEPHPAKVSAIKDMPPPQNQAELRTVCVMFNYLTGFMENMDDTMKPMTGLLKKEIECSVGAQHNRKHLMS
ncbi:retrovirus-related pol polyprotein from transposon 297 [Plakobranchus ocellatus]|uniref:Retrovirus-related pol polyprotein from transposon 297 n=1 Tax=Plakobranchus ocellatus TaxID=259542 RepID=A0AAV4AIG6_9GAST|nr:retrovirus-related pol polyprotein from transposon 297 [Plakobranchus ocellatus]